MDGKSSDYVNMLSQIQVMDSKLDHSSNIINLVLIRWRNINKKNLMLINYTNTIIIS